MLMLKAGAVVMVLAGAGTVWLAGSETAVVAGILVATGVGMFVLAQLLAPITKASREMAEQRGMKTGRLTGAPTLRSGMAVASERMASAQQQMAALTGASVSRHGWKPGSATVKLARDTGAKQNLNPVYEVHVVVAPDDGPAYDAVATSEVNSLAVSQCVPGSRVPVQINPVDPQELVLDWMAVAGGPHLSGGG